MKQKKYYLIPTSSTTSCFQNKFLLKLIFLKNSLFIFLRFSTIFFELLHIKQNIKTRRPPKNYKGFKIRFGIVFTLYKVKSISWKFNI